MAILLRAWPAPAASSATLYALSEALANDFVKGVGARFKTRNKGDFGMT
jgi:hypothetical protein